MPDDNYARRTNHDYIGSFGRIPNEPKSTKMSFTSYKSNLKFLLLCMWTGEQIEQKYQNNCHLKTIRQNNQKCNQHILGINMNIHTK